MGGANAIFNMFDPSKEDANKQEPEVKPRMRVESVDITDDEALFGDSK
jgi:hypothetical protein